jgi:uncharacterized protein (TIGR02996 family)
LRREGCLHFFDDHFARAHPARVAFLLEEGWRLPGGGAAGDFAPAEPVNDLEPAGDGEGATWAVVLAYYASDNLDGLSPAGRIRGVRVSDLARHLASHDLPEDGDWDGYLFQLREQILEPGRDLPRDARALLAAIRDDPADGVSWSALSDWLQEHGEPPAGLYLLRRALGRLTPRLYNRRHNRRRDLLHVEEHLAQLCLFTDRSTANEYHQVILFDDRWAAAHPDLANSLLRFACRWDVLSG